MRFHVGEPWGLMSFKHAAVEDGLTVSFLRSIDGPEDGARGCAIAVDDPQGETDEFVRSGIHGREVEPLDDPDACLEQRAMNLGSVPFIAAHGEVIDTHGPYGALGQKAGGLGRQIHIVRYERLSAPAACGVLSLEEDPLPLLQCMGEQFLRFYRFWILDLNHPGHSNHGLKWHLVYRKTGSQEVKGRIDVRPNMRAHREAGDSAGVSSL